MNTSLRALRKVKVLGYPFAGGQGRSGVELTPSWLQNQDWFKRAAKDTRLPIEYEEIQVSSPKCNTYHVEKAMANGGLTEEELADAKNAQNVLASSTQLRNQTYKALRDGYFPIVLGGDHSQAIGSVAGMKKYAPDTKLLWVDAHIDANTPASSPSKNAHGMPLAYLSGIVPFQKHWKCLDMAKDICYFGIRSYEEEEVALLKEKQTLVFEPSECKLEALESIHQTINHYFNHEADDRRKYWISFDIDGVDSGSFASTGTAEGNGISLEFAYRLFERFVPESIGMDFTEVNLELTTGQARQNDEATFRELFEFLVHQVNQPTTRVDHLAMPSSLDRMNNKF